MYNISEEVQQISLLMSDPTATPEQVGKVGARLFVILFGGKHGDTCGM